MKINERSRCNLIYKPLNYDLYIDNTTYNDSKSRERDRSNIKKEYREKNNNLISYKNNLTKQILLNQI